MICLQRTGTTINKGAYSEKVVNAWIEKQKIAKIIQNIKHQIKMNQHLWINHLRLCLPTSHTTNTLPA